MHRKPQMLGERDLLQIQDQFFRFHKAELFQMAIISTMVTLRPQSKMPMTQQRLLELLLSTHRKLPTLGEREQPQIQDQFFHSLKLEKFLMDTIGTLTISRRISLINKRLLKMQEKLS